MANIGEPMRRHHVIPLDHPIPATTEPTPSSLPATKPETQPSESPELERRNNWLADLEVMQRTFAERDRTLHLASRCIRSIKLQTARILQLQPWVPCIQAQRPGRARRAHARL